MTPRLLAALTAAVLLTACGGLTTPSAVRQAGPMGALRRTPPPASTEPAKPAEPGATAAVTGLTIEKLPVRCPCFELKASYDGKPLVVRFEGMPGGYDIESVELGGKQVDAGDRPAIGLALKAAAAQAGPKAMMVEDVAEALGAK